MDRRRFITSLAAVCILPSSRILAATATSRFSLERASHSANIVIELENGATHYQVYGPGHSSKIIIDLPEVSRIQGPGKEKSIGVIKNIRTGPYKKGARIIVDLKEPQQHQVNFRRLAHNRAQLIVSINDPDHLMAGVVAESRMHHTRRKAIIEIDAGHGGKDPGCISHDDHFEKYVVLNIAEKLKQLLHADPRFEPTLTRNTDIFIPLHERVLLARDHHADLFVSLHADAAPVPNAHGASVYILSTKGASSAMARWLAESQNASDRFESTRQSEIYNKNQHVQDVILDLSMEGTSAVSQHLANITLANLGEVTHLHQRWVDKAAFAVLKSPNIPSMLVENGFMSNDQDCHRLLQSAHQQELAEALHQSIATYFAKYPLPA